MKIRLKEEAVFKVDENGDIIIINVMDEDDFYYRIHGLACEVFNVLNDGKSTYDALASISSAYAASEEVIKKDIDSLVADLQKYGLIEVA